MLSHVTIRTADLGRAEAFYAAVIGTLGIGCIVDEPGHGLVGYATAPDATPQVYLVRPIDGRPAAVGNGQTLAFVASDRATVRLLHATALAQGATCEGPPGSGRITIRTTTAPTCAISTATRSPASAICRKAEPGRCLPCPRGS